MDLIELHKKIIAVARRHPPGDHVPYAFEQRVMARLSSGRPANEAGGWIGALWASAAACAAIALFIGIWTSLSAPDSEAGTRFCQDLEQTIWASVDDGETNW